MHEVIHLDPTGPASHGDDGPAGAAAGDCPAGADPAARGRSRHSSPMDLVDVRQMAALFHTPDRAPWATVTSEGRRESLPIGGRAFRVWLSGWCYRQDGAVPGAQDLRDVERTLAAIAVYDAPEHPVFLRKAEAAGTLYLDLADPAGRVVAITPEGWRLTTDPPVRFRRPRGMLPLPGPVRGGRLEELRPFVNTGSDDDFRLVLAWLLAALGPERPYPVLALHGEQGAAKSTLARVLRGLCAPHEAALRGPLRSARDLAIAAQHSPVVALDNLRSLPPWLSDALCCLATGGAFTARQLFSDDEETIFRAMRPVILTSIEEVATGPDLLDRSLPLELPAIAAGQRQTEAGFWQAFEAARPCLLGALLDAVALGLRRLPTAGAAQLPRMADFARWGAAVEPALGWEPGGFMRAYQANRNEATRLALEATPLTGPVRELLAAEAGEWTGTCKELLPLLAARAGESARARHGWPGTPKALSNDLRRIAPELRAVGVALTFLPRTATGRLISLAATGTAKEDAAGPMMVERQAA